MRSRAPSPLLLSPRPDAPLPCSVCTPYQAPSKPGQKIFSDEELVHNKLPNFGYQLFFKEDRAGPKIDEVVDQFLTVSFSPTLRAKLRAQGKPMPQMAVKEGQLEKRTDEMIATKRAGKALPVPQDPARLSLIPCCRRSASLCVVEALELTLPAPAQELLYYIYAFKKYGMHAPLNWYRNRRVSALDEQASELPGTFPPHIPALLIPAENDPALPPAMADPKKMQKHFPGGNLRVELVKGADHWVLQVRPHGPLARDDPRPRPRPRAVADLPLDARAGRSLPRRRHGKARQLRRRGPRRQVAARGAADQTLSARRVRLEVFFALGPLLVPPR